MLTSRSVVSIWTPYCIRADVSISFLFLDFHLPLLRTRYRSEPPTVHQQRIKSNLYSAKAEHQKAVEDRITSVNTLKEVVPLTEQLYAVARETNTLEHENFRLSQEQALKTELKSVLDSWVRYEQQQREAEQAALVQTVRANVEAELAKPAFKKQLLEEALTQIERESRDA
jgi:F-type H+-transporting ATPase subunit b